MQESLIWRHKSARPWENLNDTENFSVLFIMQQVQKGSTYIYKFNPLLWNLIVLDPFASNPRPYILHRPHFPDPVKYTE